MSSHRSLIWRVSLIHAALTVLALAALALFLADALRDNADAALEEQQANQARLAAQFVAPYLPGTSGTPSSTTTTTPTTSPSPNLERVAELLASQVQGPVEILDPDGLVLAAGPGSFPLDLSDTGELELTLARRGVVGQQVRFSASRGADYLHTAAPVLVDGEVVGIVHLATPAADAPGALTAVLIFLGVWSLISGALAIYLGNRVTRHSSRSLGSVQGVTLAAQRLEQGDLDYRVPGGAYDETRQLTDAFNRMADSIKFIIGRLSSERDTLSAVLDTMADGVVVTDPVGRVSLLNPAARDLLGIRVQAVQNQRLFELVRDNELHRVITSCQEEKSRQQAEVSLLLPRRYLSAIATPLEDTGSVLLTLHDLTRIRQVETSQKEFVSNVSHELRNPMASIKVMVETLESGAVNDPRVAQDFLARMRGDVDRISGLVDDLLELSRMESGQFTIETEPTALPPVVQAVSNQFSDAAAAQEVDIVTQFEAALPPVMADSEKLTQVFVNLVENALKFTPATGKISIAAQAEGEFVKVRLKDTGVGVAPQHLPHLFERFYKVDRSRRDGGTGLGLAIVKQLVEAHGGQITVESREGEGCTFTFTVPRASGQVR